MTRRTITPADGEWPRLLDELGPAREVSVLHVRGNPIPEQPMMAVVGSRRPTVAGLDATRALVTGLVEAGYGIVSGMAAGIDAAAHRAALESGGYTIAVLGFGLDVVFPRRNAQLKQRIAGSGTLVTEFPDGTEPRAAHFPQRNRIIAGLAVGTLVVEGAFRSGALITARCALDANRSVFAVPGSFRNPMAAGCNELIRCGEAVLTTEVSHIFDELAPQLAWDAVPRRTLEPVAVELTGTEQLLLSLLDDAPTPPDRLCDELGLDVGEVALSLSRMEARGLVTRGRGGHQITTAGARARAGAIESLAGRTALELGAGRGNVYRGGAAGQ